MEKGIEGRSPRFQQSRAQEFPPFYYQGLLIIKGKKRDA